MRWEHILAVKLKPDDNCYCLPGGKLEEKEQLHVCMEREIIEELGIPPKVWNILYIHELVAEDMPHLVEFFYKIENADDYMNIDPTKNDATHAFEISEIKWIHIDDDEVVFLPKGLVRELRKNAWKEETTTQVITSL